MVNKKILRKRNKWSGTRWVSLLFIPCLLFAILDLYTYIIGEGDFWIGFWFLWNLITGVYWLVQFILERNIYWEECKL